MDGSIKATVVPVTPSGTVSLREAFAKGASGPAQRQDVSFDGKVSPADANQKVSQVVEPEQIQAAVDKIAAYVESLSRSLSIRVDDRSAAGGGFVVQVQDATTEEVIRQSFRGGFGYFCCDFPASRFIEGDGEEGARACCWRLSPKKIPFEACQ